MGGECQPDHSGTCGHTNQAGGHAAVQQVAALQVPRRNKRWRRQALQRWDSSCCWSSEKHRRMLWKPVEAAGKGLSRQSNSRKVLKEVAEIGEKGWKEVGIRDGSGLQEGNMDRSRWIRQMGWSHGLAEVGQGP
ncbi:hypothetical protein COCNU_11G009540 [Cocos nucifera]|uniref:Uncharacterized protein n=1 Tax=Cocos nucifera TaxID=13894 RepID=A0A8K0IPD3_COCNU|nr:hypothetical protein COCNU_11G009540 [Cocos nucifera]